MKINPTSQSYISPEIKTIQFNLTQILCGSPMTESFAIGSESYDEDDFTE